MFIGEFLPLADPSSLNLALSTLARVGESRMEGGTLGVSTNITHARTSTLYRRLPTDN